MSFSYDTKNELCRLSVQKTCCARAEAYGILLYCNTFNSAEVRIITENPQFAGRLPKLFQRAFGLKFDRRPEPEQLRSGSAGGEDGSGAGQTGKLVFQITEREKLDKIINLLGYEAPADYDPSVIVAG